MANNTKLEKEIEDLVVPLFESSKRDQIEKLEMSYQMVEAFILSEKHFPIWEDEERKEIIENQRARKKLLEKIKRNTHILKKEVQNVVNKEITRIEERF